MTIRFRARGWSKLYTCIIRSSILEAGTVHEAMSCLDKSAVSIAFVDLRLGEESGFDLLKWLKESRREVRTICITSSSRESDFFRAREMGVDAYILKDAFIEEIMFGLSFTRAR